MSTDVPGEKQLRADARRNRERVLAAADAMFAEQGVRAGIEEIAQRAGVGVGTVCRNFPTKDALLAEVLTFRCEGMLDRVRAALAEPDPGGAFDRYVLDIVELTADARALAEGMAQRGDFPVRDSLKADLHTELGELVGRAQAAGALRPDVTEADVTLIVVGLATGSDAAARQRCARLFLDGLRPAAAPAGVT